MKKVLLLGGSRYYMRSIEAVRAAGYFVLVADRNPDAPAFAAADRGVPCDIVDREGMLRIASAEGVSAIVPLNDYGVPTAAWVARALGLPGISPEAALAATEKLEMRRRWAADGLPCPPFRVGSDEATILQGIREVGCPCILKPARGIGGASRGVVVVRGEAEAPEAIRFATGFYDDKTTLVEGFVDAEIEHSAEVIVWRGKPHVIAIGDKIKTPLPYRVDKNVLYPAAVAGARLEALTRVIGDSVLSLGITTGAAHVELATTRDGPVLFELGARVGGGGTPEPLVSGVTGVNEVVETVRILAGDDPERIEPRALKGGNYHFLTPRPGKVARVEGFAEAMATPGVVDGELFVQPGSVIPEVRIGLDRSGFLIVLGRDRVEAYANGVLAESRIRIAYEA